MATQQERIAVLETKMDGLKEVVNTGHEQLMNQIDTMREKNTQEHAIVMGKLDDLTRFKDKWIWVGGSILTLLSLVFGHLETIIRLFH